jgi:hypothetical protein
MELRARFIPAAARLSIRSGHHFLNGDEMKRARQRAVVVVGAVCVLAAACQSPTDPDDTVDVDDFLEISVTPNPAIATESTDGKTYRVVRGNNQPDEILTYDWKTTFTLTVMLNGKADDKDALTFPVEITSVTLQVKQASGGILTPPTGGELEYSTFVTQASSNRYTGVNQTVTIAFDVWYDLPSLRREAVVQVSLGFKDEDGTTFSKTYDVRVAP